MSRKLVDGYTVVYNPLISRFEEPFMFYMAKGMYKRISPNLATALAVLSSAVAFSLFLLAPTFPAAYLPVCLCILSNYIFDGVDGKIAKLRNAESKHGYLVDKLSDLACSLLFVVGYALAVKLPPVGVALGIAGTLVVHGVYRALYFWKRLDVKIGGTEGRMILVALCISHLFAG